MKLADFKKVVEKQDQSKPIEDPCQTRYNGVDGADKVVYPIRKSENGENTSYFFQDEVHGGMKCQSGLRHLVPSSYNRVGWAFVADPNGFVSYQRVGRDSHLGAVESY